METWTLEMRHRFFIKLYQSFSRHQKGAYADNFEVPLPYYFYADT
jgi:hypothetical protein